MIRSKSGMMLCRRTIFINNRKCVYVLFLITFGIFLLTYMQYPTDKSIVIASVANYDYNRNIGIQKLLDNLSFSFNNADSFERTYLVNSSECKIPSIDPFDPETLPFYHPQEYVSCRNKHLLTYVSKNNSQAVLHVDQRYISEYTNDLLLCCYSYITRGKSDMDLIREMCVEFQNSVILTKPTVLVICVNGYADQIYKNIHTVVMTNKEIEKKMYKNKINRHLSVLFIGIDSISRLNLLRSLPNTHKFLNENKFIEFKGYNKINDNTFPNLMAILTGMNQTRIFEFCDPTVIPMGEVEKCNLIWKDYRDSGFITSYAEDEADMNTFNLLKKGFKDEPTDYYYRSYVYSTEQYLKWTIVDDMRYCTGPESAGERILNVAQDFASTFKNHSNFGFFWMNSFSHNQLSSSSRMDTKLVAFLRDLQTNNIFENSIVLFISDHGLRFGKYLYTYTGWLEERLPAFYISLPTWFKEKYPNKFTNLLKNTNKLTTPYDLHMTFQDLLVLVGKNYTIKKSDACPNCKSLFEEIEDDRSCEDASIPRHYCTCHGYFTIPTQDSLVQEAANFILNEVHKTILTNDGDFELCHHYKITKMISAGISNFKDVSRMDRLFFLITFETFPDAVFQGTVSIKLNVSSPKFKIEGSVSRLDIYKAKSWCVGNTTLKKYCYCQGTWQYLCSIVNSIRKGISSYLF